MTRVADWVAAVESLYDPAWAEDWDAVGLVTGDPDASCDRALFAIDPVAATVDEAIERGVRLLVTHHPLLLRGVHGVPETDYKGRLVARLIRHGVALYVAHTNADNANPGVSDALAAALGLHDVEPLAPRVEEGAKLVTYVPTDAVDRVVDALAAAGAGVIGGYARCAWSVEGTGTFEAGIATSPAVGRAGERTDVVERRVEMVVPRYIVPRCIAALRSAHPYEEPAYDVFPTLVHQGRGAGRIGSIGSMSVRDVAGVVRAALPVATNPIRVSGDLDRTVTRVAVCGGAGDDLVDTARRAGADVYVTADLRHHPVSESTERGLALVDAGHWASEWPWLPDAAARVAHRVGGVETYVSTTVTDPWSLLA